MSDAFAVFAKGSTGPDGGDGSINDPFSSLSEAIRVADEQSKPLVIACVSTFREQIAITRRSGATLRIVGGFNCSAGTAEYFDAPSTLEAASGPSLQITESSDIELSDFDVRARDAQSPGESSIAAIIARSERIRLTRVQLRAGKGRDGASGELSPERIAEAPTGNPGQGSSGGALQNLCTCSDSIGGRGGDIEATSTRDGGNGLPALGGGKGGAGGASCQKGEGGKAPDSGENGPGGVLGELDATSWLPAAGGRGGDGAIGQGGGGGG
ncbi:MAG: hypothetical protein M3020_17535, partial [Myxococcota bacterium]|nr:hypothetical protein [Myxococcota bacterium]